MTKDVPAEELEALSNALQQLGAKRVEAALVAALIKSSPLGTQEIVKSTGLRQPEVSVGMRTMKEYNWVDTAPVPREGKGRPMHQYVLIVEPDVILQHYEEMGRQAITSLQDALRTIKKAL